MKQGLYVHIPFCTSKCKYCDFLSFQGFGKEMQLRYAKALAKEINLIKEQFSYSPQTIYMGGGTPGAMDKEALEIVLQALAALCERNEEFTIELNPETIDEEKVRLLKEYGVNRVSLGVQSAEDKLLKILGRNHSFSQVVQGVGLLRKYGIDNINLDLMYGLPEQTYLQWQETLEQVLALDPKHISTYQLKIEEGTPFYKQWQDGVLKDFDEDLAADMYLLAQKMLTEQGYVQYELSNYAQEGFESRHNLLYWRSEEYLAAGLGATGMYQGMRRVNENSLTEYLHLTEQGMLSLKEEIALTEEEQMSEMIFMGLRLKEGVSYQAFSRRFGKDIKEIYKNAIEKCTKEGLLEESEQGIKLTARGRMLGNLVFMEFID